MRGNRDRVERPFQSGSKSGCQKSPRCPSFLLLGFLHAGSLLLGRLNITFLAHRRVSLARGDVLTRTIGSPLHVWNRLVVCFQSNSSLAARLANPWNPNHRLHQSPERRSGGLQDTSGVHWEFDRVFFMAGISRWVCLAVDQTNDTIMGWVVHLYFSGDWDVQ